MFDGVTTVETGTRRTRRVLFAASSAAIQALAVAVIAVARPHRGEPPLRVVDVLIAPRTAVAPPAAPAPPARAPAPHRPKPQRTAVSRPLAPPKVLPEQPPPPSAVSEPDPPPVLEHAADEGV